MRSAGFDRVVRHIADLNTPVILVIRAALAEHRAGRAAGADAGGQMPVVLLEPVGDLFDADRLAVGGDLLFDRDDVHADAVAARTYH